MSDPIADMLARIKNAYTTNMDTVVIPFSKFKGDIANILDEEGYIRSHEIKKDEGIQGVIKVHLKYNKNGKLKALMTTTRASLPYYKEIIDEYVRFGFENIFIRPLYKLSFADENWDRVGYSAEEYFRFWKNSLNYIWDKKEISEPFSQMLLKKILSENKPMYVDLMSPCGAGIKVVAYDFNGDIYSCDKALITGEDIFKLGNTRENTYKYTFQNKSKMAPIIESSINDLWYCKKCAFQPFCGVCPVLNYNLTGKLEPGETPDDRCKILFMQFSYLLKKVLGDQEIYKDIKKRDNSIPPYEEFVFDHKA